MRINTAARAGAMVLLGAATALLGALPAYAAVPPNDTFGGSIVIGSVPFSATVDTTGATTDVDDDHANARCRAAATDASVWYSVAPADTGGMLVDVSRSSYSAGVLVVTGAPGAFTFVACGPGVVAFPADAGTTYHLLVFDDQLDGTGTGGQLVVSVDTAPAPPTMTATVNPVAAFDPATGTATVSGTATCSGVTDIAFVDVTLSQRVGRGEVTGEHGAGLTCDGVQRDWSVEIRPITGTKFAGGKAASVTVALACGPLDCSMSYETYMVQLSRRD